MADGSRSPWWCATSTRPGADALLAQALNAFTMGDNVVPITHELPGDRARGARDEGEVEGEVLDLPPLTSENDEEMLRG